MRTDQERAVESLLNDLRTVVEDVTVESAMVRYRARPLGLFGDRVLPPEIEVMRVLQTLRDHHRLTIVHLSQDGKEVLIMLRAGVELTVAPVTP
jgi:hypothetical protein